MSRLLLIVGFVVSVFVLGCDRSDEVPPAQPQEQVEPQAEAQDAAEPQRDEADEKIAAEITTENAHEVADSLLEAIEAEINESE